MNLPVARVQNRITQVGSVVSLRVRRIPTGALFLDAWHAYSVDEMGTLAAALAYYFLLALFPLMLLLIAAASPFLESELVVGAVARFVSSYLPTVGPEIRQLLHQVLLARGPVTLIAAVGLFWSTSGVFDVVQRGMNRAWHVIQPRPLWKQRLISLGTVLGLAILFGSSFAFEALIRSGLRLRLAVGSISVEIVGVGLSSVLTFLLFAIVYKVFPYARVHWRQVWGSALIAAIFWEVAKYVFVWYLANFARLNLVYGSVGAVIALLTWGYITAAILLFGAEFAAIDARTKIARRSAAERLVVTP